MLMWNIVFFREFTKMVTLDMVLFLDNSPFYPHPPHNPNLSILHPPPPHPQIWGVWERGLGVKESLQVDIATRNSHLSEENLGVPPRQMAGGASRHRQHLKKPGVTPN